MAEAKEIKQFQSENKVEILGKLKKAEFRDIVTKNKVPMKIGSITIETGEGENHRVNLGAVEYFKEPKEQNKNRMYETIQNIQDKFVSIEDSNNSASPHVGEAPTVLDVRGRYEPNIYRSRAGELIETVQISGFGVYEADANKSEEDFGAVFSVSGVVEKAPAAEMEKDEETGRYKFGLRLFDYRNVAFPMEFIAGVVTTEDGDEVDAGAWVEENYEPNQTVIIQGEDINRYIMKEVERPGSGIGRKMVDTVRDSKRERTIFSAQDPIDFEEYDEENPADKAIVAFPSQITEAVKNYEQYKADEEARIDARADEKKGSGTTAAKKGAFGSGAAKKTTAKKKSSVADNLPF